MSSSLFAPASVWLGDLDGYRATVDPGTEPSTGTTGEEYAADQWAVNARKTIEYVLPRIERERARTVVDVGCGVGAMVETLLDRGYDAYGVDVPGQQRFWARQGLPRDRFFIVDSLRTRLPFRDGALDFAFSLGVIEHLGTADGHAARRPDYREVRRAWIREVLRTLRVGGGFLVGGPNRGFPVDTAHGPDPGASGLETLLSRMAGATVHRTWGEHFLWGYPDLRAHLAGLPCTIEPQGIAGLLNYSRVPRLLRGPVRWYVERLPQALAGTGLNPWLMALVRKHGEFPGEA